MAEIVASRPCRPERGTSILISRLLIDVAQLAAVTASGYAYDRPNCIPAADRPHRVVQPNSCSKLDAYVLRTIA